MPQLDQQMVTAGVISPSNPGMAPASREVTARSGRPHAAPDSTDQAGRSRQSEEAIS
jgi:hypothetical protein